jgi:threonine dehydrogenase-like Zn-dependent dehydrogenase
MKAAVLRGARQIEIEEVSDPVVEPEGIVIKVKAAGVCGSDLHIYKEEGREGTIFGHEFSGDVVEVGAKVTGIKIGDRVTASGFKPCGTCFGCKQGKLHHCSDMALMGYQFPGAMAEYASVPIAKLGFNAYILPEELSYEDAAMVEPLSISLFSVNRAKPREKDTAVVLGAGIIGLNAIQVLKTMGVSKVLVSARRDSRVTAAKACGADLVVDAAVEDPLPAIMEATNGMGANIVLECAGSPVTFEQSVAMARGGGKIMLVGVYEQKLNWDPLAVIAKNITLIGCLGANFPGAIELLKTGQAEARPLLTHVFPLEKTAEAFKAHMEDSKAIKVMIRP